MWFGLQPGNNPGTPPALSSTSALWLPPANSVQWVYQAAEQQDPQSGVIWGMYVVAVRSIFEDTRPGTGTVICVCGTLWTIFTIVSPFLILYKCHTTLQPALLCWKVSLADLTYRGWQVCFLPLSQSRSLVVPFRLRPSTRVPIVTA